MATPPSSQSPPTLPTPAVILALPPHVPEPRDDQPPRVRSRSESELPPEWQWQRYLDLSG